MNDSKNVQLILNGTIKALSNIIPIDLKVLPPTLVAQPFEQEAISVLIGLVGGVKGRIIIDTSYDVINAIGKSMFGMDVQEEMVESLTGELGNMIAGNLCVSVEEKGLILDISPPTVMTGKVKLYGFTQAFSLPVELDSGGKMTILLTIDEEAA